MTSDFYTVFQEALVGLCKNKNFLAKNEDSCMQGFPLFTDIGKIHSSHSPPYFVSSFSIHVTCSVQHGSRVSANMKKGL